MSDLKSLQEKIIAFRDARDWKQFHNPKDVALSLVLEAGEVMEHFQWKGSKEIEEYIRTNKADIAEEMADVLAYLLTLAYDLEIDIGEAFEKKLQKSEAKYPVEKAKGSHKKYNQL